MDEKTVRDVAKKVINDLNKQGFLPVSPWLSVPEAGKYSHHSESHLNGLRSRGVGPVFYKIGSRILYHQNDLDRWIEQGAVAPVKEESEPEAETVDDAGDFDERAHQRRLEEYYQLGLRGGTLPGEGR